MRQKTIYKTRRATAIIIVIVSIVTFLITNSKNWSYDISAESSAADAVDTANSTNIADTATTTADASTSSRLARDVLEELEVKGRAPKTGYARTEFYDTWPTIDGCSLRQRIIRRDFSDTAALDEKCNVISGRFYEPYTGKILEFTTKKSISTSIQIDHVVALSDAWQKGAQYKSYEVRNALATDPLNLLAVDAKANQEKSDGDAATWLPGNKSFRCAYIARQISVKRKYELWITEAEKSAMLSVLSSCPDEPAPGL